MPMTYTDELVRSDAESFGLVVQGEETIDELRARLANFFEIKHGDKVAAWEVRTGRPWSDMTPGEARVLCRKHPDLMGNPGVMSRLLAPVG